MFYMQFVFVFRWRNLNCAFLRMRTINLLITNTSFLYITECLSLFERSSNASINKLKSNGFWCGVLKHRQDRPLKICWNNKVLKILGVYLGNESNNWETLKVDMENVLKKWKYISKCLSYWERALIVIQLCSSKLLHKFACPDPPTPLVDDLQNMFNDFFLARYPLDSIEDTLFNDHVQRVVRTWFVWKVDYFDFRIRFIKSFVYNFDSHPCFLFTSYYF